MVDHRECLARRLELGLDDTKSVGVIADQRPIAEVFSPAVRELVVMAEHMHIDGRRLLPLGDGLAGPEVDVPGDAVAVVECDLVAIQVGDVQVALADLPSDVGVLLVHGHHRVGVLLPGMLGLCCHPGLHYASTVIPDGRHDQDLVGDPRRAVDDHLDSLAGSTHGGGWLELRQFRRVVVDDVRDEVPDRGDHDPVDLHEPPLVFDEHLDPVREFGNPAIGDLQVELVQESNRGTVDSLLDMPVAEEDDRRGRAAAVPADPGRQTAGFDVFERRQRLTPTTLVVDGRQGGLVLPLQGSDLGFEFRDLDVGVDGEKAVDLGLYVLLSSHRTTPCSPDVAHPFSEAISITAFARARLAVPR